MSKSGTISNTFELLGNSFVSVSDEEEEIKKHELNKAGVIRLLPEGYLLSSGYKNVAAKIRNFKFYPGDVITMGQMKSGTTWLCETVWNLIHNADLKKDATTIPLMYRAPFFEEDIDASIITSYYKDLDHNDYRVKELLKHYSPDDLKNLKDGFCFPYLDLLQPPRIMKSHLPLKVYSSNLLNECKIVYITRDVRDVISSMLTFSTKHPVLNFKGSIDELIELYLQNKIRYTPFWSHVKEAWNLRNHKNLHFLFYEDLKQNPVHEISKIADFLKLNLSNEQIQNVAQFTKYDSMKSRGQPYPALHDKNVPLEQTTFFGKGISGNWKHTFCKEQGDKITKWMKKNLETMDEEFRDHFNLI